MAYRRTPGVDSLRDGASSVHPGDDPLSGRRAAVHLGDRSPSCDAGREVNPSSRQLKTPAR
ncbi:hypothetical protein EWH23_12935 [Meiothermus sp. PNK-Is4]|nr:hypothetical protein EWH23_12935 [Meiothermus sp. PNK-Is4]